MADRHRQQGDFINLLFFESKGGRVEMYLREKGWDDMGWIHLAQDRDRWSALVNTVMILRVP
jgi:hypothetical protein